MEWTTRVKDREGRRERSQRIVRESYIGTKDQIESKLKLEASQGRCWIFSRILLKDCFACGD
jgi:hypothetical protein